MPSGVGVLELHVPRLVRLLRAGRGRTGCGASLRLPRVRGCPASARGGSPSPIAADAIAESHRGGPGASHGAGRPAMLRGASPPRPVQAQPLPARQREQAAPMSPHGSRRGPGSPGRRARTPTCMSEVQRVKLSRRSCMMSVESLYDSSPSVSSSAMASSKACGRGRGVTVARAPPALSPRSRGGSARFRCPGARGERPRAPPGPRPVPSVRKRPAPPCGPRRPSRAPSRAPRDARGAKTAAAARAGPRTRPRTCLAR